MILSSIGAADVPGAGLIMLTLVLTQLGVPLAVVAFVAGVDPILDRMRTLTTIGGDLAVTTLAAKYNGAVDFDPGTGSANGFRLQVPRGTTDATAGSLFPRLHLRFVAHSVTQTELRTARVGGGVTPAAGAGTAREFWQFYRGYVDTPIHAVSAAALAIFGILVFVDPLFALLAIASYVVPPVVLFSIGWRTPSDRAFEPDERSAERARRSRPSAAERGARPDPAQSKATGTGSPDPGADLGAVDTDTDTDSDDGDTDSDSDDGDTDSDSDDGDTDSDTDS